MQKVIAGLLACAALYLIYIIYNGFRSTSGTVESCHVQFKA